MSNEWYGRSTACIGRLMFLGSYDAPLHTTIISPHFRASRWVKDSIFAPHCRGRDCSNLLEPSQTVHHVFWHQTH